MAYSNVISRADAAALIPAEVSNEIIKALPASNPLLSMARRLPNMSRATRTMPVMSALATAYFVNGDTGLKQTTELLWAGVNIHAEELAAIVPIPEAVLDDADYDIWGEVKPALVEAFGVAIAQAVLYGTNIPASWATDLGGNGIAMPAAGGGAAPAGHVVSLAAYADLYEALLGETAAGVDGVWMVVEADGFDVTGAIGHTTMKGLLRNCRDVNGLPIFTGAPSGTADYRVNGVQSAFPNDGSIVAANSLLVAGDWTKLVYSMRQDITYKVLDQAVIQDAAGNIVYNLAQQDMVALRAVMRLGFALPNPINRMNQVAATRYPFCVMTP
jgi:HK97 family phage major capsid protein